MAKMPNANRVVAAVLLLVLLGLPLSLSSRGNRLAIAREMLADYTAQVRWSRYWLPSTVSSRYVPGREVDVQALFAPSAAGFCASALEICQLYQTRADGTLGLLVQWIPEEHPSTASLAERFSHEYANAMARLRVPIPRSAGQKHEPERSFSEETFAAPSGVGERTESFDSPLTLAWKLLALTTPKSISAKVRPADLGSLRQEVQQHARAFGGGCRGEITIPFYGPQDPRLFVYLDLSGNCQKAVLEFVRTPEGGWNFSRFVVDEQDLKPLASRIVRSRMEKLVLGG